MTMQQPMEVWYRCHAQPVWGVAISDLREGNVSAPLIKVVSARLRDQSTNLPPHSITVHSSKQDEVLVREVGDVAQAVAISADGSIFAVGGNDRYLTVYDLESRARLWEYKAQHHVTSIALSADGLAAAATSKDGHCRLFSILSSAPLWSAGVPAEPTRLDVSLGGKRVVAGTSDGSVLVFDEWGRRVLAISGQHQGTITGVAVDDAGATLAVTSEQDRRLTLYDATDATGAPRWTRQFPTPARGVALSADGRCFAVLTMDGIVSCYRQEMFTPTLLWSYQISHEGCSIAMSGDARFLIIGSQDGWVTVLQNPHTATVSRPTDASMSARWMAARVVRACYLASPHAGICGWFGLFDWCFSREHMALCEALLDAIADDRYVMTAQERHGVHTRRGALRAHQGMTLHRAGEPGLARERYREALREYEQAGADGAGGAGQMMALLATDLDAEALRQAGHFRKGNRDAFLLARLDGIRDVRERLDIVRIAAACGWVGVLEKVILASDSDSGGRLEDPVIRANAIAACERLQPGLTHTTLIAAIDTDPYWVVRWRAAAQLRRFNANADTRPFLAPYQGILAASLRREQVAEVREELDTLIREMA